ncbi:MAG: cation-translocating P-type ATPase, partial [Acidimicrobiia bacterium]
MTLPDIEAVGLSEAEAARRLAEVGPNELPPERLVRWYQRSLAQLVDPMAILLLGAAAVSGLVLEERVDAVAILTIVLLNAAIGAIQEGRAARALAALRTMEAPSAAVVRGGRVKRVPARDLVPGDLVLLSEGDRVPADLELLESEVLEVDESLLTGESLPVPKPGGDLLYSGTLITHGRGSGIVLVTGGETAMGRIAERLREPPPETPLQAELRRLTRRLTVIALGVAAGVFLLLAGLRQSAVQEAFLTAVALAVAAIPEGLPTVVTVALALGVRRMAQQGAIVRRLPAVETLGSTTMVLTDKTGTLTENRLRLDTVLVGGQLTQAERLDPAVREHLATVAILCNDASLDPPVGDPIEIALLEAFDRRLVARLVEAHRRVDEVPFDARRRRMTTLHAAEPNHLMLVKGAPEAVVPRCSRMVDPSGEQSGLDPDERQAFLEASAELASQGNRVLALALRTMSDPPVDLEEAEHDLTLVGLAGLRDPIRESAGGAVRRLQSAGVRPVMVTGDHPGTARHIAEQVGLTEDGLVVTGEELAAGEGADVDVYARVDPEQKLELVRSFQSRGEVVAVTGDGVNDAPALRQAAIGVAMGRSGSDVAREAADMVVTDDDLATIVTAVGEGRAIFDNIRKVVDYLVAGNLSEVLVVLGALALFPGGGVPLLPLQLLWVNLLTDGLPALALGVDPPDPLLMERPPRDPSYRLLSIGRLRFLAGRGVFLGAAVLTTGMIAWYGWGSSWPETRSLMFTSLVFAHVMYAFAARLPSRRAPRASLVWAIGLAIALQTVVMSWGPARALFETSSLGMGRWSLAALSGVLPAASMLISDRIRGGRPNEAGRLPRAPDRVRHDAGGGERRE